MPLTAQKSLVPEALEVLREEPGLIDTFVSRTCACVKDSSTFTPLSCLITEAMIDPIVARGKRISSALILQLRGERRRAAAFLTTQPGLRWTSTFLFFGK